MKAFASKRAVRQVSQQTTIAAPTGGMNAAASISAMPDTDAIFLTNWVAQPYGCAARKGWVKHSTGLDGDVQTVMTYPTSGNDKLFAITGTGKLYDVSVAGPVGAPAITGLTVGWWQYVVAATAGGQFLLAANGQDNWIKYDGATLSRVTSAEITGVDPKSLVQLELHQRRLWAVQKDTTKGWYSAPDAIQGAFTAFDFGPMFRRGGKLAMLVAWTIDDGDGADDHLVAISTEGEAAVYAGIDPSNAATWSCVGVYYVGPPPAGHRFALKTSGDVLLVTEYGLVYLSEGLLSTKVNQQESNSSQYKIQAVVSNLMSKYKTRLGWKPFVFPDENLLLVNMPPAPSIDGVIIRNSFSGIDTFANIGSDLVAGQIVQNNITKGWSLFDGYDAFSWALRDRQPYFGSAGVVGRIWEGYQDAQDYLSGAGVSYACIAQPAFSYFGSPGSNKHFKMFRLNLVSDGNPQVTVELRNEFDVSRVTPASLVPQPALSAIWDLSLWDQAKWSGFLNTYKQWRTANGIGFAGTISLAIVPDADTFWASTDWVYEQGGVW